MIKEVIFRTGLLGIAIGAFVCVVSHSETARILCRSDFAREAPMTITPCKRPRLLENGAARGIIR